MRTLPGLLVGSMLVVGSVEPSAARSTTKLHGVVLDLEGKTRGPLQLRATNHGTVFVNANGEFVREFPKDTSFVMFTLVDSPLQIIYPLDGRVNVPVDPRAVVRLVIGASERELISDALARRLLLVESALADNGVRIQASIDLLSRDVRQKLRLDEEEIDSSLRRERAALRPRVHRAIQDYMRELKNLRDSFEEIGAYAYANRNAAQGLRDALEKYNKAFDVLDGNRQAFETQIRQSWDEANATRLAEDLTDFYREALDETHKPYVLRIRRAFVNVQRAFDEKKPKQEAVRRSLEIFASSAQRITERIDDVLEEQARALTASLAQD